MLPRVRLEHREYHGARMGRRGNVRADLDGVTTSAGPTREVPAETPGSPGTRTVGLGGSPSSTGLGRRSRRGPQQRDFVGAESFIQRHQGQPLRPGLGPEEPVERVAVVRREARRLDDVVHPQDGGDQRIAKLRW